MDGFCRTAATGSEDAMALVQPEPPVFDADDAPPRKKLSWRGKFRVAFRGWKLGVRGHSSFFVHFFFTALVFAAAAILNCTRDEWCVLIGCIGFVLTAELFNSAIETLFRALPDDLKERVWPCLDISAGAVLMASLTASIIGLIVLLPKLPNWTKLATLLGIS
jgi:diacylglycerol kinase